MFNSCFSMKTYNGFNIFPCFSDFYWIIGCRKKRMDPHNIMERSRELGSSTTVCQWKSGIVRCKFFACHTRLTGLILLKILLPKMWNLPVYKFATFYLETHLFLVSKMIGAEFLAWLFRFCRENISGNQDNKNKWHNYGIHPLTRNYSDCCSPWHFWKWIQSKEQYLIGCNRLLIII